MKKIYLFFVAVLLSSVLIAQSYELRISDSEILVEHNDTVFVNVPSGTAFAQSHLTVKNISDVQISTVATREDVLLPEGMLANFCFGVCYGPTTMVSDPVAIEANDFLTGTFDMDLRPGEVASGIALFKITLTNQIDEDDNISFFVQFNVATVGIANGNIEMALYPNPMSDVLNVNVNSISDDTKFELYDALGKLVLAQSVSSYTTQLDVSELLNGLYFIKLRNGNAVLQTRKLVKR